ncbi:MAG TPA: tripartite tricarboxylate transporter substrate binding protein, partial [Chloroflexota bacterium]|nr:tripartite tricarboxylate transporter substrate binding protein [Chloroflexota bacterium]
AATTAPAGAATTAPAATKPAAAAATTAPAAAKIDYPTRPIELVVPFAAGGAADVAARKIGAILGKELGQTITVANVTGAGGAVAYSRVKNAKPDGYSLLWSSAAMATLPAQGNVDFDYKAFDHVAMVATETVTLAVAADSPYKSFKDFLDQAAKRGADKPMTVGNSGVGSFTHLSAVAVAENAKVPFTHIAFGTGLAVTNLLGGHIDASVQHPAELLSTLKNNQVRMLTVSNKERIPAFKDVPTLKEQGIDLELIQFRAVSAPKGTPKPILDKLETAMMKAADSPEWKEYNDSVGSETVKMGSGGLTMFLAAQHVQIAELSKNVKPEEPKK